MTPPMPHRQEMSFEERVARHRARKALEAQAIAEGKSDIVTDRPLTEAERREYGLDDDWDDGSVEDEANLASQTPSEPGGPRPLRRQASR